jgi:hypothetical protein
MWQSLAGETACPTSAVSRAKKLFAALYAFFL